MTKEFESIKEYIYPRLVNKNAYKTAVCKPFKDLKFIYFVMKENEKKEWSEIIIDDEFVNKWEVSIDEIDKIAMSNFTKRFELSIKGSTDTALLISTKDGIFGATYMADIRIWNAVASSLKDDFYIIPASIHELLIVPAKKNKAARLNEIIRDINSNPKYVAEDIILANHVYFFSRDKKEIISM